MEMSLGFLGRGRPLPFYYRLIYKLHPNEIYCNDVVNWINKTKPRKGLFLLLDKSVLF